MKTILLAAGLALGTLVALELRGLYIWNRAHVHRHGDGEHYGVQWR